MPWRAHRSSSWPNRHRVGLVYLAVAVWGFMIGGGDSILSIIPVNTEDNVLHLLLVLGGLAAGLATAEAGRAASAGPATT